MKEEVIDLEVVIRRGTGLAVEILEMLDPEVKMLNKFPVQKLFLRIILKVLIKRNVLKVEKRGKIGQEVEKKEKNDQKVVRKEKKDLGVGIGRKEDPRVERESYPGHPKEIRKKIGQGAGKEGEKSPRVKKEQNQKKKEGKEQEVERDQR